MPWTEVHKVDLRRELIYRYLNKEKVTDLCREYGISRKTAYKFIHRFQAFGLDGLKDQSRRPHHLTNKTDALTEQMILDTKFKHPSWGAKKLETLLRKKLSRGDLSSSEYHQCHPLSSWTGEIAPSTTQKKCSTPSTPNQP